jgi:hypothetical protein
MIATLRLKIRLVAELKRMFFNRNALRAQSVAEKIAELK